MLFTHKDKRRSSSRKIFTGILAVSIAILEIPGILVQAADFAPKDPKHVCIGEDTTEYDTITFGSYPQTQVTGDALTDAIINADYDSTTGDAVIDGVTYRRMSRDDATSVINYPAEEGYRYFKWEPVKWKVLEVSDDDIFVMAEQTLDCQEYNSQTYKPLTWEHTTLRKWLNEEFYSQAFSPSEQQAIKLTDVKNNMNSFYATDGGNDTTDRIYLLSEDEVKNTAYGFCPDTENYSGTRNISVSDYSYSKGTHWKKFDSDVNAQGSYWWLRTLGMSSAQAIEVANGRIDIEGSGVKCSNVGIVPVMHLKREAVPQTLKSPVHICKTDHISEWDTFEFGIYPKEKVADADLTKEITDAVYDENGDAVVGDAKYRRISESGTADTYSYYKWEPIPWKVLSYDGETLTLMAQNAIACKGLDEADEDETWSDCSYRWSESTLRKWLNETFYQQAFSEKEKETIRQTKLTNSKDVTTEDYVYLPFSSDMLNPAYGFCKYSEAYAYRVFAFTEYAKKQRTEFYEREGLSESKWPNEGIIWLRGIKGAFDNYAASVTDTGSLDMEYGNQVDSALGVVPMIRVNYVTDTVADSDKDSDIKDDNTKDNDTKDDAIKDNPVRDNSQNDPASGNTQPSDHTGSTQISVQALKIELPSQKLAAGKKVKLKTIVTPVNADNQKIAYKVDKKKYASVNQKGELVLKKAGAGHTIKLTAMAQDGSNVRTSCKISIMKHAVKKVKLSAASKTIKAGKTLRLKTTVAVTGKKANKKLNYTSSNQKYATVTKKGTVKAKKAGKGKYVTITATATDGSNQKGKIRLKIK